MKRIITLLLAIIVLAGITATAQQPVRWRTFVKATGPNEGTVTFRALIEQGWHLYGLDLPKDSPRPTEFNLEGSKDIEFTGKIKPARKAIEVNDPLFGMTLSWWDSNIEFTIPFKITGKEPKLHCIISFMACDGTTCRPPAKETISTPINLNK